MAEFAAASSAAGLVSLGLQVFSGLTKYYSAFKNHDEDTSALVRRCEGLATSLELLSSILLSPGSMRTTATAHVEASILDRAEALHKLEKLVQKFSSSSSVAPGPLALATSKHLRRAIYPFQKPEIASLNATLNDLDRNLNVALQLYQLSTAQYITSRHFEHFEVTLLATLERKLDARFQALHVCLPSTSTSQSPVDLAGLQTNAYIANGLRLAADTQTLARRRDIHASVFVSPAQVRNRCLCLCQCLRQSSELRLSPYCRFRFSRISHTRSCPLRSQTVVKSDKSVFVRVPFGSYVAGAYCTLTTTRSAARSVISRTLICRRVVEVDDSDLRRLSGWHNSKHSYRPGDIVRMRQVLLTLLAEGKVLPTDVDTQGLNWVSVCQTFASAVQSPQALRFPAHSSICTMAYTVVSASTLQSLISR